MKKVINIITIACITVVIWVIVCFGSRTFSNRSWFDTVHSFEYGKVNAFDGEIVEGKVTRWLDYENSDMIEVTIGGKTYMTHSSNVILISE